jgi:aspartate aminotransferase
MATARFLGEPHEIDAFGETMHRELQLRLNLLHDGLESMRASGLPVHAIEPQGAIYLSVQFDLIGRANGRAVITTNDEIRKLLLEKAGFAVVPFQAFGSKSEDGWFRLSVGAVSPADIEAGLARVREALQPFA